MVKSCFPGDYSTGRLDGLQRMTGLDAICTTRFLNPPAFDP